MTAAAEAMRNSMRIIFNDCQTIHKHDKSLKELMKLQCKTNTVSVMLWFECFVNCVAFKVTYLRQYYIELLRNIKLTLHADSRSPFTKNVIDFIIKYLLKFSPSNGENYYSEDETSITLIDTVLSDVVKPYMYNVRAECRINSCNFVRKLIEELDDISESLYESLKTALIERCIDKVTTVRAVAILALHRFQDLLVQNDIAIVAIRFHLKNDPDCDVRLACLQSLAPCKQTLSDFIHATRDVKDFVRKAGMDWLDALSV